MTNAVTKVSGECFLDTSVTRPAIRYHGGKWKLAPWLISHFPAHRVYCEPFGGGANVLIRKSRSYAEIYNDLDLEVVNLFRVLREQGDQLKHLLQCTPFARDEFLMAWYPSECQLEQARRTVIRSFMGFGSAAVTLARKPNKSKGGLAKTGFRANSNRSGTTPAHDWANYPKCLDALIERLSGVVIENRDAVECMSAHDSIDTLHYVDPPYLKSTRDGGDDYRFEMVDSDHEELIDNLKLLEGAVVVSGYENDLYSTEFKDWICLKRPSFADGARARVECIWMNRLPNQMEMGF